MTSTVDANRPTVVMNAVCSIDGRIALTREQPLLVEPSSSRWASLLDGAPDVMAEIRGRHRPGAIVNGSGSFVISGMQPFDGPAGAASDGVRADVGTRPPAAWFVVADSRGRVRWSFFGDEQLELLVLVTRGTPLTYLDFLHEKGVSYLMAGDERVEPATALRRLHNALGVSSVVLDGGGELNASFLRAGLVDELYVTILPAVIGGRYTPSTVDGPTLGLDEAPLDLQLVSTRSEHGFVVLHYVLGRRMRQ